MAVTTDDDLYVAEPPPSWPRGRNTPAVPPAPRSTGLEYLQIVGAPAGLLSGADPSAFHILAARPAGENVATAIAFDYDGDCGVLNLPTLEAARHQGGSAPP